MVTSIPNICPRAGEYNSGLPALALGWLSANLVWNNLAQTAGLYSLNQSSLRFRVGIELLRMNF